MEAATFSQNLYNQKKGVTDRQTSHERKNSLFARSVSYKGSYHIMWGNG